MDPKAELNCQIADAIASRSVNGVLPANATLLVLDPVSRRWEHYAVGGTADWFAKVIDQDAIIEVYRRARLDAGFGEIIVDYRW